MGISINIRTKQMIIFFAIQASVALQSIYFIENECNAASNATTMTAAEMRDDAKIKAVWAGMRAALKAKDINRALTYFSDDAKDTYEYNFNLLKGHLDDIISILREIELDEFREDVADYNMLSDYDGDSFVGLVRFVKDSSGNWRIKFF